MIEFAYPLFVLPFALATIVIAGLGLPPWDKTLLCLELILIGVIAGSSGMRIFEKRGPISKKFAPYFFGVAAVLFLLISLSLNWFTFILSPLAFSLIPSYFYTKRFARGNRLGTGIALGLIPFFLWIGMRGSVATLGVILSLAVITWMIGSDLLHHPPFAKAPGLSRIFHGTFLFFLFLFGGLAGFGTSYLVLMMGMGILLYWEHRLTPRLAGRHANTLFWTMNGLTGLCFFLGTLAEFHLPYFVVTVP